MGEIKKCGQMRAKEALEDFIAKFNGGVRSSQHVAGGPPTTTFSFERDMSATSFVASPVGPGRAGRDRQWLQILPISHSMVACEETNSLLFFLLLSRLQRGAAFLLDLV